MTKRTRLSPEQRRNLIVAAALRVANKSGSLQSITDEAVAKECTVATSKQTVRWYFRLTNDLRAAVAAHPEASDTVRASAKDLGLV